jgi:hypothetical protein
VVGSLGDVEAAGAAVGLRSAITDRLQGAVEYTTAASRIASASDLGYFLLLSPAALRDRTERLHGVSTSVEAEVPETSRACWCSIALAMDTSALPSRAMPSRWIAI